MKGRQGPKVVFTAGLLLLYSGGGVVSAESTHQAQQEPAYRYLMACVLALQTRYINDPDRLPALDCHSCADLPELARFRTPPPSRITVRPGLPEGFTLTVTPLHAEPYRWSTPRDLGQAAASVPSVSVTQVPPEPVPQPSAPPSASLLDAPAADWRSSGLSVLLLGLVPLLTSRLPSRDATAVYGWCLLPLGLFVLVAVPLNPPTNDGGAIYSILFFWNAVLWLALALIATLVQRVAPRHQEPRSSWPVTLGSQLVWLVLPAPVLLVTLLRVTDGNTLLTMAGPAVYPPTLGVAALVALGGAWGQQRWGQLR